MCQIPYIGPTLDFIITSLGQKEQDQRLIESLAILQEEIYSVDENKIDKEFPKIEEFLDIFRKAFVYDQELNYCLSFLTIPKKNRITIASTIGATIISA